MRRAVVSLALVLALGAPAAAGGALRIRTDADSVTKIGRFEPERGASLKAARRAFGKPSSRRSPDANVCNVVWDALGLNITFVDLGGGGDACTSGSAQTFVAHGERFATWRGLRVHASARAVLKRHPDAKRHRSSFWLEAATSETTGVRYPVLEARFGQGRVTEFAGYIGAAGD